MRKELHVSHIPQPPKPVTIPLSSKKKQTKKKNQKQELRMRTFLGYHMGWKDRNVTYIYSFEPHSALGCQGDSDDVIGSISQFS